MAWACSSCPQDELARNQAMKMFEIIVKKEGLTFLGWRVVPTAPDILGERAVEVMPYIAQGFVAKPVQVKPGLDFDRKLYVARRVFEQSNEDTYVVSLSSRTIVYKGMFLVGELRRFFADLQDEDYRSAIAIVHSRFSTNTNPSWMRAHPTVLSCITARSTPSGAMRIRWLPVRKTWSRSILNMTCTRFCPSSARKALTPPCWTMRWNSW